MEPVFGTLKEFLGLRKVNTIGIRQANKCMHLAAIAFNLKKYLKFTTKKVKTGANALKDCKTAAASIISAELLALQANLKVLFLGFKFPDPKTRIVKKPLMLLNI
ncbi:transposase [Gillisia sp. Q332]|uniref:transposase n=1 Tax=Gillisia xinjiangensis TaxID=3384765 RepID=UPI00391DF652